MVERESRRRALIPFSQPVGRHERRAPGFPFHPSLFGERSPFPASGKGKIPPAMPLALILSSYVAASRIGGGAQQYALAAHGIDPVLVPTILLGRNPARGAAGQVVDDAHFAALLGDVEADGLFGLADLVIAGHFSSAGQVALAARTIARIRDARRTGAFNPKPVILVDPILGDAPKGLYVRPEVAEAMPDLVALADVITPNRWELSHLSPGPVAGAADRLGRPALVTSAVMDGERIGAALVTTEGATLYSHEKLAAVPHGTGDLVAASLGAGLVQGLELAAAAERAVRAAAHTVRAAVAWDSPELPLVALGPALCDPQADLTIELNWSDA